MGDDFPQADSIGKIATSWYSLLSLFLWIHKRTDLEFLGFQHPLRWLAHQAKRFRLQWPWPRLCGVWYVISVPATAMSSVSGLCSRHTTDFGYTCRASQILPGFIATPSRFPAPAPVRVQQVDCRLNQLQWRNQSWPPMLDSRIMDSSRQQWHRTSAFSAPRCRLH